MLFFTAHETGFPDYIRKSAYSILLLPKSVNTIMSVTHPLVKAKLHLRKLYTYFLYKMCLKTASRFFIILQINVFLLYCLFSISVIPICMVSTSY